MMTDALMPEALTLTEAGDLLAPDAVDAIAALAETARTLAMPGAWTTGAGARDGDGNVVGPLDERAVCWCLTGALERTLDKHAHADRLFKYCYLALRHATPDALMPPSAFNDQQSDVAPVLTLLNDARLRIRERPDYYC